MKNHFKYLIGAVLLAALSTTTQPATAKNKCVPKIYAFGFAASFSDSTVYFTDIQEVDSAWIQEKSRFLVGRNNYSYQLRDYLAGKGEQHRTCMIMYALKRKDIDKKYLKMKQRYTTRGRFSVNYINENEFKFSAIEPMEEPEEVPMTKAERKAARKAAKEAMMQQKRAPKNNIPPRRPS